AALEFFTKYHFLGEVGGFVLSRLKAPPQRIFRVKHEYFAAALNDCNLFELLNAIENKRWIKISYRNGLSGVSTRLICFPMEIRISSVNGREYLTFYEPFVRNYSNLRLEFVDSVEYIRENTIEWNGRTVSADDESVQSDLEKAKELIRHSWGAATLGADSLNDNIPLCRVSFKIKYDPKSEGFIPDRLNREKRQGAVKKKSGQLDFSVKVLNSTELQPWVRSFYSRLYDYREDSDFSVREDVETIISQMENPHLYYEKPKKRMAKSWSIPADCKYKTEPKPAYSLLFNEIFGIYYTLIGEILMNIYSDGSGKQGFTAEQLDAVIKSVLKAHRGEMGVWTEANLRREIKPLLQSEQHAFMRTGEIAKSSGSEEIWYKKAPRYLSDKSGTVLEKAFRPKYSAEYSSFGTDICPLTGVEARWLLTVLNDPKADLFLTAKEKEAVARCISAFGYSSFKADAVKYFDRYYKETDFKKERGLLTAVIFAIKNHRVIEASYISKRGNKVVGSFKPLTVEYSKRDDVFRIFALSCGSGAVFTMILNGIQEMSVTDNVFDFKKAMSELDGFFAQNKSEITVEFYDRRNLTDRILSEFSPWEKQCLYNKESELYSLTVSYQKTDELEMVIRLMGYGNEIVIKDQNHPIALEIKRRLYRQREILAFSDGN
ncbi:MAG: WYL domain-containing protein, partial [[Eubacterium] siraeum]|nr:WYL domain-containing protein [[Eubacterium] siraeum]